MVTISESNKTIIRPRVSAQLRYAMTYVMITVVVLTFLNLYCATANEQLFRKSKHTALLEKARV